jgi:hydrogenase maturation protein HypF
MTSGNMSDEPIVISNDEAVRRLGGIADHFLIHNRDIAMRVDDSIVRVFEDQPRVLRRSRGFAPQSINLGRDLGETMAFGAELKNTFCLTRGQVAILSQHIGDLENLETMHFFEETAERMKQVFRISPKVAAYDLHPGYLSTQLALNSPCERKIGVQHHHAHIASCMAENRLEGTVLGVALDGTGYGTDGAIWGGEFLVASYAGFRRAAHLRYVPMAGGDAAVRQPWRMALSYLRDTLDDLIPDLPALRSIPEEQRRIVSGMLARSLHTVSTSSCGRLFDAVAAMLGLASEVSFEGQAAIALESIADPSIEGHYDFAVTENDPLIVDLRPTIASIVRDLQSGKTSPVVASRFHNTLSAAIVEVCTRVRIEESVRRICLSGGSFQNIYLLRRTVSSLLRAGFEVFLQSLVPPNDGGMALGQAVIACEMIRCKG